MRNFFRTFQTLSGIIVLFYFLPIVFWNLYAVSLIDPKQAWSLASTGLVISVLGALALIIACHYRELYLMQKFKPLPQIFEAAPGVLEGEKSREMLEPIIEEKQQQIERLLQESAALKQELDAFQENYEHFKEEQFLSKQQWGKQLEEFSQLDGDQKRMIEQQRITIDQKQQNITHLENQIHDLRYEIKTLLQLAELEPAIDSKSSIIDFTEFAHQEVHSGNATAVEVAQQVRTIEEASFLLKRCLDIAQKITSGYPFGLGSPRLRDLPMDHHALDLRRLFDSLRSENASLILFFSRKDNKVLFANNQTKSLLGWSPEKFVQDFLLVIQDGIDDWKNGLASLASKQEVHTRLMMKTKFGDDMFVGCCLGAVPTGVFKGDVIAVIYPL